MPGLHDFAWEERPVSVGIALLERAAHAARELGELPPHTDAVIGKLGLLILQILKTSPEDQAMQVQLLGKLMERRT